MRISDSLNSRKNFVLKRENMIKKAKSVNFLEDDQNEQDAAHPSKRFGDYELY